MKATFIISTVVTGAILVAGLGFFGVDLRAFTSGMFEASGRDGLNCSACHSGATGSSIEYSLTPVNPTDPPIESGYVPGASYDVVVGVGGGPDVEWGFAWDANGGAGTLTDPVNTQLNTDPNFPANFTHTSDGKHQSFWSFQWTAPDDIKTVTFWGSGNSADGASGPSGDAPTDTMTLEVDPIVDTEILCRRGNVSTAIGQQQDVVFVNGSPGAGTERKIIMTQSDPFTLTVEAPWSIPGGPAPFVLYFYLGEPTADTLRTLPRQIGLFCQPMPLTDESIPKLKKITNNIGKEHKLGESNFPSSPAPSTVLDKPAGVGKVATIFIQGLIVDQESPSGKAAVTNGIVLDLLP